MRERGRYQIQLMKTRSSSGVGAKVDLEFDIDTLRISDIEGGEEETPVTNNVVTNLKRVATKPTIETPAPRAEAESTKLRQFLNNLGSE